MLEKLLDRFREKGPSRPRTKTETEKRRRYFIVLLIVVAVVSAVSIVGYGYYDTSVRPWNQRILKVNGTVIEMRAFVKTMRTWMLLYQSYGSSISPSSELAQYVASSMEENELMRQELEGEFGIDVGSVTTDSAVEARIRNMLVSENATDEEFDKGYDSFKTILKSYGLSARDFKKLYIEPSLVSEELQKQIGDRDYPSTDNFEHAQVQALLVSGADEAAQLRARWEAGEDFDMLISEKAVSSYQRDFAADNATLMEWVPMGTKGAAFDGYAFAEVWSSGVISDPIEDTDSTGSYWLIKVVARESRALSESDRETLAGEAYSRWLEEASASENNDIVNYLEEKGGTAKLNWALDHVTVSTG